MPTFPSYGIESSVFCTCCSAASKNPAHGLSTAGDHLAAQLDADQHVRLEHRLHVEVLGHHQVVDGVFALDRVQDAASDALRELVLHAAQVAGEALLWVRRCATAVEGVEGVQKGAAPGTAHQVACRVVDDRHGVFALVRLIEGSEHLVTRAYQGQRHFGGLHLLGVGQHRVAGGHHESGRGGEDVLAPGALVHLWRLQVALGVLVAASRQPTSAALLAGRESSRACRSSSRRPSVPWAK